MPRTPKPAPRRRNAEASRAQVWAAAAAEFAARGFDGAKVDRIAADAGVNKAMIYYHFKSKAGLFNAILHDTFSAITEAVRVVAEGGGPPEDRLRAYVAAMAHVADERPFFPPIWLREIAEGGRHVDPTVANHFRQVLMMLGGILQEGAATGRMRPMNPFLVQMGIVGPLTLFMASRPLRARFSQGHPGLDVSVDAVVNHVQAMVLAGVSTTTRRGHET